jgi:hypothetical protein
MRYLAVQRVPTTARRLLPRTPWRQRAHPHAPLFVNVPDGGALLAVRCPLSELSVPHASLRKRVFEVKKVAVLGPQRKAHRSSSLASAEDDVGRLRQSELDGDWLNPFLDFVRSQDDVRSQESREPWGKTTFCTNPNPIRADAHDDPTATVFERREHRRAWFVTEPRRNCSLVEQITHWRIVGTAITG